MAQSQAIFDCCGGNPLLLFPLPEDDNGCALLPSCTCDWDETLALCLGKRPCQKRCHCVALGGICLRVERHSSEFLCFSIRKVTLEPRGRNKTQAVDKLFFTVYVLAPISRVILTVHCEGQIVLKGSVSNPNVNPPCRNKYTGM